MNTRIALSLFALLPGFLLAACAPPVGDPAPPPTDGERAGAPLDDEGYAEEPYDDHDDVETELWVPTRVPSGSLRTPLRVVTNDRTLEGASVLITTDRDVGVVSPSLPLRFGEVDGWLYATNGPGFSMLRDALVEPGPLTFTVRRADDPSTIVASATTEITAPSAEPSAEPCLGGGNVAVWQGMGSYGGATGAMLRTELAGPFTAIVRDIDYIGDEQRSYAIWTEQGHLDVRLPGLEAPPIGQVVPGKVRFPGACSGYEGEFVIVDHEEGERLSELRARASRLTMAWRAVCRGHLGKELAVLRGCAHFDARNPQVPTE